MLGEISATACALPETSQKFRSAVFLQLCWLCQLAVCVSTFATNFALTGVRLPLTGFHARKERLGQPGPFGQFFQRPTTVGTQRFQTRAQGR
jgi:hypothetical protein